LTKLAIQLGDVPAQVPDVLRIPFHAPVTLPPHRRDASLHQDRMQRCFGLDKLLPPKHQLRISRHHRPSAIAATLVAAFGSREAGALAFGSPWLRCWNTQ